MTKYILNVNNGKFRTAASKAKEYIVTILENEGLKKLNIKIPEKSKAIVFAGNLRK